MLGLAALLAGCGTGSYPESSVGSEIEDTGWVIIDEYTTYKRITLPDGRVVECLFVGAYNSGGPDCNWNSSAG